MDLLVGGGVGVVGGGGVVGNGGVGVFPFVTEKSKRAAISMRIIIPAKSRKYVLPALVCVSVCLSVCLTVTTITKKIVDDLYQILCKGS